MKGSQVIMKFGAFFELKNEIIVILISFYIQQMVKRNRQYIHGQ